MLGETEMIQRTGCRPLCKRAQYSTEVMVNAPSDNFPGLDRGLFFLQAYPDHYYNTAILLRIINFIQLYYPSSEYMEKTEYFVYGLPSLMADFGGYLGLLMGHSLLSLYDAGKLFCFKNKKALVKTV